MKYYKKIFLILVILIGSLIIFSNKNMVQAKTVSDVEKINATMLEQVKASKLRVLTTPQIKVQADPTQQDISKYYYNQLKNDISRITYNSLQTALSNQIDIELNNYEYSINEETQEAATKCFNDNIVPYILDGYNAYIIDGAKNYWWTPDNVSFGYKDAIISNHKVIFKYIEIISPVNEWINYNSFNTKLKQVSNSITGNSVYEIVRSINYYICNNVEYKVIDDTDIEQTAYGALMMNKAVCEGQAQLFNLLCREKGIISLNVYGYTSTTDVAVAHAWNYVYVQATGKWYAVDVTWNNQLKDSLFFMVGSETIINNEKFSKNHIPGFKQYVKQTYTPSTPILSEDRYIDTIALDEIYINNIQPNTRLDDFEKEFSNDIVFTVNEGERTLIGTDIVKTGQILTVGNELSYTLVVKGDVNGDGRADIQDLLVINKHRLNKNQLTGAYLKAGDVNKDGSVDIKDILQVNKYRLGKISEF